MGKEYSTVYCMTEVVVLILRPLAETRDRFLPSRAFWEGGKMAAGGERIWCPRERATYLLPGCLIVVVVCNQHIQPRRTRMCWDNEGEVL